MNEMLLIQDEENRRRSVQTDPLWNRHDDQSVVKEDGASTVLGPQEARQRNRAWMLCRTIRMLMHPPKLVNVDNA